MIRLVVVWQDALVERRYQPALECFKKHFDVRDAFFVELPRWQLAWLGGRALFCNRAMRSNAIHGGPRVMRAKSRAYEARLKPMLNEIDAVLLLGPLFCPFAHLPPPKPYFVWVDAMSVKDQKESYARWTPPWQHRPRWAFQKEIAQNALRVFPFSEWSRQRVLRSFDLPEERVIRSGWTALLPVPDEPVEKNLDEPLVLFAGSNYVRKGAHTLARAVPLVRRHVPNCRFVIAGNPGTAGPPLEPVEGLEILGPVSDRQQMMDLFRRATVFCLLQEYEPAGHVWFEAMGYSTPCVGTNICAAPEVILEGQTGYLVPVGDHEAAADRIVRLLTNPAEYYRMSKEARALYEREGRWDQIVGRMADHMKAALEEHRASGRTQESP